MVQDNSYFFVPRVIADKYENGWEGYKTLVLGVFHVCADKACPYREHCLKDSAEFDETCPAYSGMDSYYRLSNSNEIEVESYLEGISQDSTYNAVTKYFLKTYRHPSEAEKRSFWDSIAFTNFIQNFQGDSITLDYAGMEAFFDRKIPCFVKVLNEFTPEVIYVIDTAVADCIKSHIGDIPGLTFVDEDHSWSLPIFRFLYNVKPKARPEDILKEISYSRQDSKLSYGKLRCELDNAKSRNYLKNADNSVLCLLPHIWDKAFYEYTFRAELNSYLTQGQKSALKKILSGLYEEGYTTSPEQMVFKDALPRKLHKYQKDGFVVETFNYLNNLKNFSTGTDGYANIQEAIPTWCFVHSMGVSCSNEEEWRTKRKNEYSKHKDSEGWIIKKIEGWLSD